MSGFIIIKLRGNKVNMGFRVLEGVKKLAIRVISFVTTSIYAFINYFTRKPTQTESITESVDIPLPPISEKIVPPVRAKQFTITPENAKSSYEEIHSLLNDPDSIGFEFVIHFEYEITNHATFVDPDPLKDIKGDLANLIKEKSLIKLNISGTGVDTDGLKNLAVLLGANNTLGSLNLANSNRYSTKVSDTGLQALFGSLAINRGLRDINLRRSNIQRDIGDNISAFFLQNKTMQSINLEYNSLSAYNLRNIVKAILANPFSAFVEIKFTDNDVYNHNCGVNPNPGNHDNWRFSLGDKNEVHGYIREINDMLGLLNATRLFKELAHYKDRLKMQASKISLLPDDLWIKTSEMLFGFSMKRHNTSFAKAGIDLVTKPLTIECKTCSSAGSSWTGPKILNN